LERATEKAKNESLESICDDVMEFQRTGLYDSMYLKTRLESKECYSKHWNGRPQGNIIVHLREVLKIWENYISEFCDRNHRP
jgi:hypothetical protein